MSKVNPEDLEQLMNDAGVGERVAAKLRQANNPKDTTARGHGPAREDTSSLGSL